MTKDRYGYKFEIEGLEDLSEYELDIALKQQFMISKKLFIHFRNEIRDGACNGRCSSR